MNAILEAIESLAIGRSLPSPLEPLLDFRSGRTLTRRDLAESVLVLASVGKGKTTLGGTFARAFLRDRQGGLFLTVKRSQIEDVRRMCRLEGRERDLVVLGPGMGHRFNPLEEEPSSAEAAALVAEIAEVLASRTRGGGENESFWRQQLGIILRNLFTLCRLAYGRHDLILAATLFDGRASTLAELSDPTWQERSAMAAALATARKVTGDPDAGLAVEYFEHAFPTAGDRLQGSLAATVASVFDYLRRPPLLDLFTGRSTFCPDDMTERGKICVVGLPALDSADGRIANAIMQYCFCRAVVRQPREHHSFLISDECQETVTQELVRKLAVMREYKVASVMLSQNLAVLDDRIGETLREGLSGLLNLKVFGPQIHAATRQWAAEQVGKRKMPTETKTTGRSRDRGKDLHSTGTSVHEHWDYRVPPSRFSSLGVGETICLRDGAVWLSRWHKDMPGKGGTVAIVDD